ARQLPIEQVSVAFSKISIDYKDQKADGALNAAVRMGWDVKQNKQV
ncbi:MAG: hypothetical protein JNJ60_15185, partial [Rhodocyclaceae bacterium]|nr:hypothetical protein [Rhodocyclaceae bacterium]